MRLIFDNEMEENSGAMAAFKDFPPEETAVKVAEAVLEKVGCPYEAQVNLLITHEESIREMNLKFRGIDKATDVLSFPMLDFEKPGDFSFLEKDGGDCFDPESGELLLGDIVISADRCVSQAEHYGHSVLREYAFLIAHSMLHLSGYDHLSEEDEKEMFSLQDEILDSLGITR